MDDSKNWSDYANYKPGERGQGVPWLAMPDIRELLVESVQEAEIALARRKAALAAYDGATLLAVPAPEPEPEPKLPPGNAGGRRSPELVDHLTEAILANVLASPRRRARVVDVHQALVVMGELENTNADREFVRYILRRKLAPSGRLVNLGRGLFEAPDGYKPEALPAFGTGGP